VVDGVDLLDPRTDINRARQRIGMVFQSFNLYPHMTALGNVTLALRKVAGKSRAEADELGRPRSRAWASPTAQATRPASYPAASSSASRSRGRSRSSRA
jgi:ABC-type polar amino acid transport system ATPase subunit